MSSLSNLVGERVAGRLVAEAGTSSEKAFMITAQSLDIKCLDVNGETVCAKYKYYPRMDGRGYVAACAVPGTGIFYRLLNKMPKGKKIEKV